MAFKQISQYVEEKNGVFFTLPNDNDSADVIFLYQSINDVLVADVHYISSKGYNGYAHCLGDNCPACNYPTKTGRGIRKQSSIFIPLYNIQKRKVEFWDRTPKFENVLQQSVFKNFPNPSEYVFRITRHGQPRDPATRYEVKAISRNADYPYAQILADFNMVMPDSYSLACKELTYEEMDKYLNSDTPSDLPNAYNYVPVPRNAAPVTETPEVVADLPELNVPTPNYNEVPMSIPRGISDNSEDVPPFEVNGSTGVSNSGEGDGDSGSGDDLDNVAF